MSKNMEVKLLPLPRNEPPILKQMTINRWLLRLLLRIQRTDDLSPVKVAEDGVDTLFGPENGNADMGMLCFPQLIEQRGRNGIVFFPSLLNDTTDLVGIEHIVPSGGG